MLKAKARSGIGAPAGALASTAVSWNPVHVCARFTERSRHVVALAEEEARALTHEHVGTEHLLLGLLREEEGLAARVLNSLQITLEQVREQVAKIADPDEHLTAEQIPLTLQARDALERALALGHNYIGTEHILLGLLQGEHGAAVRILLELGASRERVRSTLLEGLSAGGVRRLGPGSI